MTNIITRLLTLSILIIGLVTIVKIQPITYNKLEVYIHSENEQEAQESEHTILSNEVSKLIQFIPAKMSTELDIKVHNTSGRTQEHNLQIFYTDGIYTVEESSFTTIKETRKYTNKWLREISRN